MTLVGNEGGLRLLLEAEVAPRAQPDFEKRYHQATGHRVAPGNPVHYQDQPGKWGAELRVYFNDEGMREKVQGMGIHVEYLSSGYMSGQYQYRFSNNDLWWNLVENEGLRLGPN